MIGLPRDFAVLLPPRWVRLPLDGGEAARVATIVGQRVAEVPVSMRETYRQRLTQQLLANLREARDAGGVDYIVSLDDHRGLPMAGTCLVTVQTGDERPSADDLLAELGVTAPMTTCTTSLVELAGLTAVRRQVRSPLTPVLVTAGGSTLAGDEGFATTVEFVIPLPGTSSLFALHFATPIDEIAPAMVELFDAIASTLAFQW